MVQFSASRPLAPSSNCQQDDPDHRRLSELQLEKYAKLKQSLITIKSKYDKVIQVRQRLACEHNQRTQGKRKSTYKWFLLIVLIVLIVTSLVSHNWSTIISRRCVTENNYFVMEMTRPLTNCAMCSGIDDFLILTNPTRQQFADYAYSGRPTIVRQSTANWTAMHLFNYTFFQTVYSTIAGAHEAVENECQFFPFRTSFVKLREVFEMPAERVNLTDTSQTWYIGWSNCNPDVAAELRRHYQRPHFLPLESESSAIDWIFMGHSGQGASMHMDYVFRPSWQAQISGRKSWHLLPPPECEHLCPSLRTTVSKGDIILVDTNQWYHDTFIHPGELSITIGSEYD